MTYNVFGGTLNPAQSNPCRLGQLSKYIYMWSVDLQYLQQHAPDSGFISYHNPCHAAVTWSLHMWSAWKIDNWDCMTICAVPKVCFHER